MTEGAPDRWQQVAGLRDATSPAIDDDYQRVALGLVLDSVQLQQVGDVADLLGRVQDLVHGCQHLVDGFVDDLFAGGNLGEVGGDHAAAALAHVRDAKARG